MKVYLIIEPQNCTRKLNLELFIVTSFGALGSIFVNPKRTSGFTVMVYRSLGNLMPTPKKTPLFTEGLKT